MAQKITKLNSNNYKADCQSNDVDTSKPALIVIEEKKHYVDGEIAKFILELLEEVDSYKEQLEFMENITGSYGEG
jgi:phage-related minor tail protein|tara:strand:+ start:676 stop:900 length:225 start_codon:yes stop_codon:yes gene_type:complete